MSSLRLYARAKENKTFLNFSKLKKTKKTKKTTKRRNGQRCPLPRHGFAAVSVLCASGTGFLLREDGVRCSSHRFRGEGTDSGPKACRSVPQAPVSWPPALISAPRGRTFDGNAVSPSGSCGAVLSVVSGTRPRPHAWKLVVSFSWFSWFSLLSLLSLFSLFS